MSAAKFPLATLAVYGPNNKQATKLVAAVFRSRREREPVAIRKWFVAGREIRDDAVVGAEVAAFLKEHQVAHAVQSDRILGCPHEEGIDYPLGGICPECPFWAGIDRFTHRPKSETSKIGRNDPCHCGSGKKFKKCCGQ